MRDLIKLEKQPLADALIEIRFEPDVKSSAAVFGILYQSIKDKYPVEEELPILQLPANLIKNDSNLIYKPHYRLESTDKQTVLQIGPKVLSVASVPDYVGWEKLSLEALTVFENTLKSGVINHVSRLGMRYINFFEDNIFNNIEMTLNLAKQDITDKKSFFRTQLNHDEGFFSMIQISNDATRVFDNKQYKGSLLDIDTFKEFNNSDRFEGNENNNIEIAHDYIKKLFVEILKDEFIESLKPTWK